METSLNRFHLVSSFHLRGIYEIRYPFDNRDYLTAPVRFDIMLIRNDGLFEIIRKHFANNFLVELIHSIRYQITSPQSDESKCLCIYP